MQGNPLMNRRAKSAASYGLALAFIFTGPLALSANLSFSVALTPPPPIVETPPPPPAPGYVWTSGYWSWDGVKYVWVPGRYVVAPFPDAVWVGGGWVHHGPHWTWVDGRWHHR
jgi:hypothetical protein